MNRAASAVEPAHSAEQAYPALPFEYEFILAARQAWYHRQQSRNGKPECGTFQIVLDPDMIHGKFIPNVAVAVRRTA